MQIVEEPTSRDALLDPVLTNKEGLVGDVKVMGTLGCSDHEMAKFRNLHGGSRAISRIKTWTSGKLTLASSGTYLEESHGSGL